MMKQLQRVSLFLCLNLLFIINSFAQDVIVLSKNPINVTKTDNDNYSDLPTKTASIMADSLYIVWRDVDLYEKPSTDSFIEGFIKQDTKVYVLTSEGRFTKITDGRQSGYVYSSDIIKYKSDEYQKMLSEKQFAQRNDRRTSDNYSRDDDSYDVDNNYESREDKRKQQRGFDVDLGFTYKGHMTFSFGYSHNANYFGLTIAGQLISGARGVDYTGTIDISGLDWDKFEKEGSFTTPITFDLGYKSSNSVLLGIGVGYATKTIYRNFYNRSGILSPNNHLYYITKKTGGAFEGRIFCNYYIESDNWYHFYVKAFYSLNSGGGLAFGVGF